ncbi:MAG: CTP synthase, partial [Firmicutes bacterium]|nr:CTP synthase [Bacillota bacterium]
TDSASLSPKSHGEIYITEDGRASDLLTGHYERILDTTLSKKNEATSGEIYQSVINKERDERYGGAAVQVVPHITDEIKSRILFLSQSKPDVVIIEVGGTVGDIEAQPFFEALRQLKNDLGKENVAYVHVSLVPFIAESGEQKTKPTQHSVRELQNLGIVPDVIVCRTEKQITKETRDKLALFCGVEKDCIIQNILINSLEGIYDMPLRLADEGFCSVVLRRLKLETSPLNLSDFKQFNQKIKQVVTKPKIKVGIVSKFSAQKDAHISLRHALFFASLKLDKKIEFVDIDDFEVLNQDHIKQIKGLDAVLITSGIGKEYSALKFSIAKYTRANKIPTLLIGDGFIYGVKNLDESKVFKAIKRTVDSSRGLKTSFVQNNSILFDIFGSKTDQRHFNLVLLDQEYFKTDTDLIFSAFSKDNHINAYELPKDKHPFFMGVSFLPQFNSKIEDPNPILTTFLSSVTDTKH